MAHPGAGGALINAPDDATLNGKRDRGLLALLVGCGLRRGEAVALTPTHVQRRDGRWVIVDLRGKHGRVAIPAWVMDAMDASCAAAGHRRRAVPAVRSTATARSPAKSLSPQAILDAVVFYGSRQGLQLKPHDTRS